MSNECSNPDVDCSQVIRDLATFLDGEMDDGSKQALIDEHLGDCPPCREKADLEECVKELLRSRCAEQAPPGLIARLESQLAQWST